ncbi:hypothetical protein [Defluviimonas sp. SAOS-178_SWC]|uniref:hypothetical protein n=1 Tax=Defluviimonas sp. SAOS-178_SWC TaxID=3121287 RepID=UPI0032221F30
MNSAARSPDRRSMVPPVFLTGAAGNFMEPEKKRRDVMKGPIIIGLVWMTSM